MIDLKAKPFFLNGKDIRWVEADDTVMFDYSLFYAPTLLDYYEQTHDRETLAELWPTAWRQMELAQESFDEHGLVRDSDALGWCFVDWNLGLNKQASAQGIYLYCLKAAGKINPNALFPFRRTLKRVSRS